MKYFVLLLSSLSFAQTYQVINEENSSVSYRGLAFQDAKTFIVSGSKNTIGKTTDGGKTFSWINPKVVENRDFRDVEVLGKDNYLALGIDYPAYILQTKDGGKSWNKVYENNEKGIFLNAIYVDKTSKKITVLGDPMSPDKPFVLTSSITDPTKWEVAKSLHGQPLRLKNPKEAFFASSGSNLYVDAKQTLIATGGELSNLYYYTPKGGQMYALEKTKSSTSGINGMAYDATNNVGYLVGGDFTKPEDSSYNFYKFKLTTITQDSYNTCTVSPDKKYVILVGNKGKIGKITF